MAVYLDAKFDILFLYIYIESDLLLNQRMIIWYIVVWCLCNWPLSGLVSAHRARRLAAIETNLSFSCTCSFSCKQRSKLLRHFSLRWTVTIIRYSLLRFHSSTGNLLRSPRHSSFRTFRFFEFWKTRGLSSLILNIFFFLSDSLNILSELSDQFLVLRFLRKHWKNERRKKERRREYLGFGALKLGSSKI